MTNRAPATPADAAFQSDVSAFLDRALTPDLQAAGRATTGVHSDLAAARIWHRRLFDQGWIAPAWPRDHGGPGWSLAQRLAFERACAARDAPILSAAGIRSLGPLLIGMGTEDQRRRHLPAILSGAALWCQGFSETGAGSDLARLATRARRQGDHYIVDGAKIWTTDAHHATHMFALTRTAISARPQEGITFLLIDMATPGIEIRPIPMLNGEAEFAEVRFDAVVVPVAERVGAEGEGWSVARRLMRHARSNNTTASVLHRAWRAALRLFAAEGLDGDPAMDHRRATLAVRLVAFEALEARLLAEGRLDGADDVAPSLLKTLGTELHQAITAFALDAVAGWGPDADAARPLSKYLATRAASIYSGTNETHRNLMARAIAPL